MNTYLEIDVTSWLPDGSEKLGTHPKRWLRDPDSEIRWLMKDTTSSKASDGSTYRKGDDWSERIATGVADSLDLPVARTELAFQYDGDETRLGVISKTVLSGSNEKLVLGQRLLKKPVTRHDRSGYTIRAIRDALEDVEAPAGTGAAVSAWDVFAGYLVLDALIGNTDRHEENWAVVEGGSSRCLSPTFDHASSLGFGLSDTAKQQRLTTNDRGFTPEAWADRAKTKFHQRPSTVDTALEARMMQDRGTRDVWLGRCEDVERLVEPIWLVPEHRMSVPARKFAERVIRRNRERLLAV